MTDNEPLHVTMDRLRSKLASCAQEQLVGMASDVLALLTKGDCGMPMEPERHVSPIMYDAAFADIHDSDLELVCEFFDKGKLSAAPASVLSASCFMYGEYCRVFCMMPVSRRGSDPVWAPMLYDSGAPVTYLTEETFDALKVSANDDRAYMCVNGCRMVTHVSRGDFRNVNVLGQDYMKAARATVTLDYARKEGVISVVP